MRLRDWNNVGHTPPCPTEMVEVQPRSPTLDAARSTCAAFGGGSRTSTTAQISVSACERNNARALARLVAVRTVKPQHVNTRWRRSQRADTSLSVCQENRNTVEGKRQEELRSLWATKALLALTGPNASAAPAQLCIVLKMIISDLGGSVNQMQKRGTSHRESGCLYSPSSGWCVSS